MAIQAIKTRLKGEKKIKTYSKYKHHGQKGSRHEFPFVRQLPMWQKPRQATPKILYTTQKQIHISIQRICVG